ncbi:MAG: hypothetical protein UU87_C0001G0018 [Parcubacteria group bacterium GW2011_GWA2_42_11]|nr:MAG: hypothetical protein UU87_C0001G0018 [Parcubacteria group bacterium GW2011_GWA2_42_11]
MLIDTHAHINFNAFKNDGDEAIRRALSDNVWLINVGSQYETSARAIEYAEKYPGGVFAAVGLHPFHLLKQEMKNSVDVNEAIENRPEEFDYDKYKVLAQNDKVIAIGEAGLDYHYDGIMNDELRIKEKQKAVFRQQINLAIELGKPLIVHCREAHDDVIEILRLVVSDKPSAISGVIHSFSGRWSQAEEYLAMGFYLGFNGIITFARDYDRVVREAPLNRLLVETDCPYLTPMPFRGKRNEPAYVKYVAQKIADLRGIAFEEVAEQTTKNAKKLFNI